MAIQQGMNQMSPAQQHMIGKAVGSVRSGVKRRVKRSAKRVASSSGSRKRKSSGRKLKFGSPAWQKKYKVGKYKK